MLASHVPSVMPISADEIALYDRQIRLWGIEAQERMRSARILLVDVAGLGSEIAKNLVLAGVGHVTLLDDRRVSAEDLGAGFLFADGDIGAYRAEVAVRGLQRLNGRVGLAAETGRQAMALKEEELQAFDVVVTAGGLDLSQLTRLNARCRAVTVPFYASEVFGLYGFCFADPIHRLALDREQAEAKESKGAKGALADVITHNYGATLGKKARSKVTCLLPCVLAWLACRPDLSRERFIVAVQTWITGLGLAPDLLDATVANRLLETVDTQLSPVAAVMGGIVAQEILNLLGGQQAPIDNFMVYDGDTGAGPVFSL